MKLEVTYLFSIFVTFDGRKNTLPLVEFLLRYNRIIQLIKEKNTISRVQFKPLTQYL